MATTAGVYFNSTAAAPVGEGAITGKLIVPVGVAYLGGAAGTSPFDVFNTSGAPFPCVPIALHGVMAGAGAAGMTIQLQTSAGVAISDVINVAALVQYGTFAAAVMDFVTGIVNPGGNLRIVTVNAPAAILAVEFVRVEI
jgi:hypothetical protein